MLKLAFDNTLRFGIKPKVKVAIYATPVVCTFASIVGSVFLNIYLGGLLGFEDGVPVKDQEHGGIWVVYAGVAVMGGLALVGYVIGWTLNALGFMLLLRWPYTKVVAVFSRSEIPREWCKAPEKY
jgi:hypothetical protein